MFWLYPPDLKHRSGSAGVHHLTSSSGGCPSVPGLQGGGAVHARPPDCRPPPCLLPLPHPQQVKADYSREMTERHQVLPVPPPPPSAVLHPGVVKGLLVCDCDDRK